MKEQNIPPDLAEWIVRYYQIYQEYMIPRGYVNRVDYGDPDHDKMNE